MHAVPSRYAVRVPTSGLRLPSRGVVARQRAASGVPESARLLEVDDLPPERGERNRDQLEVRDAERNPDDREAHQHTGDEMAESQPPSREHEPEDVSEQRPGSRVRTPDQRSAEGPYAEPGD